MCGRPKAVATHEVGKGPRTCFSIRSQSALPNRSAYIEIFMDTHDAPKYSPIIDHRPFRWSCGKYIGRKRVVIAWFDNEADAKDFAERSRYYSPGYKYDYLPSMF